MQPTLEVKRLLWELKKCSKSRNLERGKAAHAAALEAGSLVDVRVLNTLVSMYAKCGSLLEACDVFEGIKHPTTVSWNVLMSGYVENGEPQLALELFARMQAEEFGPDGRSFVAALRAVSVAMEQQDENDIGKQPFLEKGMALHTLVSGQTCRADVFVDSCLLHFYGSCSCMWGARRAFHAMQEPDLVSWNAIMLGYAENGEGYQTMLLLACMLAEGYHLDRVSFIAAFKACFSIAGDARSLQKAMAVHCLCSSKTCDLEVSVSSTLAQVYATRGLISQARRVFELMPCRDAVAWSSLILRYAENEEGELGLDLLGRMICEGCAPDAATLVAALKAYESLDRKVGGTIMALHTEAAARSCDADAFLTSVLVDTYTKCGCVANACRLFDTVNRRSIVHWTALLMGYAENGDGQKGLQVLCCMQLDGCALDAQAIAAALKVCSCIALEEDWTEVDGTKLVKVSGLQKTRAIHSEAAGRFHNHAYVVAALVDVYSKCGSVLDARRAFDGGGDTSVVCWNTMMFAYIDNGEPKEALDLFTSKRLRGCSPDARTLVAALRACGMLVDLEAGQKILGDIVDQELDASVADALIDFYGKCGCMADARTVFDSVDSKGLLTWTSLMTGYSLCGDTQNVLDLFEEMTRVTSLKPDAVTFLCILTTCSRAGLVEKGKEFFEAMRSEHGIDPSMEHYRCMVDMLGRANQMEDAVALVSKMPFGADVVTWTTLLGACLKWKNAVLGRLAYQNLVGQKGAEAAQSLMANIYATNGMWEEQSLMQRCRAGR